MFRLLSPFTPYPGEVSNFKCNEMVSTITGWFQETETQSYLISPIRLEKKNGVQIVSEVGFEPTPTRVDCDLNAAP